MSQQPTNDDEQPTAPIRPISSFDWQSISITYVRDLLMYGTGFGILVSQVFYHFLIGEPSATLIGAGVTLLAGPPLLHRGDRRSANGK